jgi:hypothetical protein
MNGLIVLRGQVFEHQAVIDQLVSRFQQHDGAVSETGKLHGVARHHAMAEDRAVLKSDDAAIGLVAEPEKRIASGQGKCSIRQLQEAAARESPPSTGSTPIQ